MANTARRGSLLVCCAVLLALTAPACAVADSLVAEIVRDTPISSYGGALAWSDFDEASGRYRLVIRRGASTAAAPIATASRAFDVSLGPDARGRVVALYTRCRTATRGCDVYRYDLRRRREHRLASVSSPAFDEAWPAQWRDRIVVSRRIRTPAVSRSGRRGSGRLVWCFTPHVKTLSSRAPSRRLASTCAQPVGMAIRDDVIVDVTETDVHLLRAGGGRARLLAHAGRGEGGYSPFVSPSLSRSAVWLTRTGERETGEPQGLLRIALPSGRVTAVRPNLPVAGRLARDERGRFWYVQGPEPDSENHQRPPFCVSSQNPCRLVRASANPFSTATRTLLPRLRMLVPGFLHPSLVADEPVLLSGDLTRAVVRGGNVVARRPAPATDLDLLMNVGVESPSFVATVSTTRSNAAGRWSFVVRQPPPIGSFTVAAVGLRLRGPTLSIYASARVGLTAHGRALTGAVAPAQPGRVVEIERFALDAQGRLPDGTVRCPLPMTPNHCDPDTWVTVVRAPLDAAGTGFSATVDAPGTYRGRLPADPDENGLPTAYGGVSDVVRVAG